jgi:hypothetical protein
MTCFKAIFRHSSGKAHENRETSQSGNPTGLLRMLTTNLVNKVGGNFIKHYEMQL